MRREHNANAWMAWHVAALSRSKRLPPLKRLMLVDRPKPQTWQEQKAIIMAMAQRLGPAKRT